MYKETYRKIKNGKARIKRLIDRRNNGGEIEEALEGSQLALEFIHYLDVQIKKEEDTIQSLTSDVF